MTKLEFIEELSKIKNPNQEIRCGVRQNRIA